jgi:hypothetical protein
MNTPSTNMPTHATAIGSEPGNRPYNAFLCYAHHGFIAHRLHTSNSGNISYESSNCPLVSVPHFRNCNGSWGHRPSKLLTLCADALGTSALPKDVISNDEVLHVGADVPEKTMRHMLNVNCVHTC